MPIHYVIGDLFVNRYQAQAFAHGCNCQGVMGAGIAVSFREHYPEMYLEYRRRCKADPREFNPGEVFLWQEKDRPAVFNLGTQENTTRSRATYENIEKCLAQMRRQADEVKIDRIAIPHIGAGYGGLTWVKVQAIIENVFADWPGDLYVYEYAPETE